MPLFEIRHHFTTGVLFSIEADSSCLAIQAAVSSGADLRGANLSRANLSGADLSRADLNVPVLHDIDQQILTAIEAGGTLEMSAWHTCHTTHCRAGWAIFLAGGPGSALEHRIGASAAGALIYAASAGYVPNFHAANATAMADIRAKATGAKRE